MRSTRDVNTDFGQMGIRIPAVAVSPYVRRGHVAHSVFGFESILKLISYRFGLPALNRRHAYAQNIGRSFDWRSKPRLDLPALPTPPAVMGAQCSNQPPGLLKPGAGAQRPREHDLAYLRTTGYLDTLGFKYRPATPASTFREPHKVLSAQEQSK
jgi:phospholipase C